MNPKFFHAVASVAAALLVGLGGLSAGRADTITDYNLNQAQCGGSGCGEPAGFNFGTVVVDINTAGTSATITYNLTTGTFHEGSNGLTTAVFDMAGVTSWSETSGGGFTWAVQANPSEDGLGTFPQGERCTAGVNHQCGTNLVITAIGTNLATALNSNNFFAGVDIFNVVSSTADACRGSFSGGLCTYTGAVGTSLVATPVPPALALLASVFGLGFFRLQRRRAISGVAAA
jgi:hypothetical protein